MQMQTNSRGDVAYEDREGRGELPTPRYDALPRLLGYTWFTHIQDIHSGAPLGVYLMHTFVLG